jgi:hypothetical protein
VERDGSTPGSADVDLAQYLVGRERTVSRAYLYAIMIHPVIQTILGNPGVHDEFNAATNAIKPAPDDGLDGIDGTELSTILDAADSSDLSLAAPVPEPATMSLVALAGLALIRRRMV